MKISIKTNLKLFSLILLFTFTMPVGFAFSAGKDIESFTSKSAYLRITFDQKQKAYSARWANELKAAYKSSPEHFRITASKHPGCPSNVWWSTWPKTNKQKDQEADRSLVTNIKKNLKGFPQKTVAKCIELSPIFANGTPTDHWRNKKYFTVIPSTLVIKDNRSGALSIFRTLVEQNFMDRNSPKVAYIYNENLQQTCSFKQVSNDLTSAIGSCKGIGTGKAIGKVTNIFKGEFTMAFFTQKASIFMTNLSPEKAKQKFPEVFK